MSDGVSVFTSVSLQSGLKGEFRQGVLVRGEGVEVVGLRCKVCSKSKLAESYLRQGWSSSAASSRGENLV